MRKPTDYKERMRHAASLAHFLGVTSFAADKHQEWVALAVLADIVTKVKLGKNHHRVNGDGLPDTRIGRIEIALPNEAIANFSGENPDIWVLVRVSKDALDAFDQATGAALIVVPGN